MELTQELTLSPYRLGKKGDQKAHKNGPLGPREELSHLSQLDGRDERDSLPDEVGSPTPQVVEMERQQGEMKAMIKTRRASATYDSDSPGRMRRRCRPHCTGVLGLAYDLCWGSCGREHSKRSYLTYTVEDLGTNFSPEDINSTGQVEGEGFSIDCGRERAILYHVVPSTDIRECLIWWNGYR